jgi:hypothetical protein
MNKMRNKFVNPVFSFSPVGYPTPAYYYARAGFGEEGREIRKKP